MHRALWILGLSFLVAGCSDDTVRPPDQKVTPLDKGPSVEAKVGDGQLTQQDGKKTADGAAACQGTTKKVEEFAPKANAVTGWAEDLIPPGKAGLETGYTDGDIEGIIDGHQDPYAGKTDGYVREFYRKGNATLTLQLWDLKTASDAKTLYDKMKTDDETLNGIAFSAIADAPEESALGNNKPSWKVWGHKCDYHWEITACATLADSSTCDPAGFDALKPDVIAFVQYLTKQLP